MKILFVTFRFPPYNTVGAVRTGKTAEILKELGHDVKILTASNQGLSKTLNTNINSDDIISTDWFDVNSPFNFLLGSARSNVKKISNSGNNTKKVKVLKSLKDFYKMIIQLPDGMIGWYPYAVKSGIKIIENWKPDIIYASAMPFTSLIVARNLAKKFDIPWIGELRDLWSQNHYRKTWFADKLIEKKTLSSASALVTISEPLANSLRNNYSVPCYVIKNGFDEDDWLSVNKIDFDDDKIKMLYAGFLYQGKRDPSKLFEIISRNEELKNKVIIDFYYNNIGWVKEKAEPLGIGQCVRTHDTIERDKILQLQKSVDILLLLTWDNSKEQGVLPGKLFEYIASETPILSMGAMNNEASKIITKDGFGISSNDEKEITNFILNVKSKEYQNKFYRNVKLNKGKYNRKIQVKKLEEILSDYSLKKNG